MAYMKYVEEWVNGEGEHANKPKMSKEEWRKMMMKGEESAANGQERRSVLLNGSK